MAAHVLWLAALAASCEKNGGIEPCVDRVSPVRASPRAAFSSLTRVP